MKKRILSILLTACMVFGLLPSLTQPAMALGDGTGNPDIGVFTLSISGINIISNADQLAYVAQQVNAGTYGWGSASYKLGNDINLESYTNWTPIGKYEYEFYGTFDGGGHIISNLRINTTSSLGSSYGLFGEISGGTVKNVGLSGVSINVTSAANSLFVGGLAGNTDGTIENCFVTGNISGTVTHTSVYFGGLVGRKMNGTVNNCYTTAAVSVTGTGSYSVGGLAGYNRSGYISYSYWLSTAVDGVGTDSKPGTGNCRFTGTNSLTAAVTVGGANVSTLLDALNAWLNSEARTDLHTWISSESYPVFGPLWTPPTYTATVTVHKNDSSWWESNMPTIKLSTSPSTLTDEVSGTSSGSDYTFSGLAHGSRYYVWEDTATDTYTGQSVTKDTNAATVNYYTVTYMNDVGMGLLNTQTVLSGKNTTYGGSEPAKDSTAQYAYTFSGWVTEPNGSTPATLTNITAATTVYASFTPTLQSYTMTWKKDDSTTIDTSNAYYGTTPTHADPTKAGYTFNVWTPAIESVTGAATYTATWTLDTYHITYTLNGGTDTSANPPSYNITSSAFTLTSPTRPGYAFVGWSGTGLSDNTDPVTIQTGSTGDRSYTANWKADAPSAAPSDTIVTKRTNISITITTQPAYEYRMDNGIWYKGDAGNSLTFTGLSAGIEHFLCYRVAAVSTGDLSAESNPSPALGVTTKADPPDAPSAPTIGTGADRPTSDTITISTTADNEYYISTHNAAPVPWPSDGDHYFKAPDTEPGTEYSFTGLAPETRYYIHVRVAETDFAMPSASTSVAQYTLPPTPSANEGYTISYSGETIGITSGYEVSTGASFGTAIPNHTVLAPGGRYCVRVAASGGVPASEAVSFTLPPRPTTPTVITVDKTKDSITITPVAGQEYNLDGGVWLESGSYTGLSANTAYTVYTRVKATGTTFASADYSINVTTKSAGSVTDPSPDPVTYDPGKTLGNVGLPVDWDWIDRTTTIPTVTNSGYKAVYAPKDTESMDYSDELGFSDISGTVTITRTIALTVNPAAPTAADFNYNAPAELTYNSYAKAATVTAKDVVPGGMGDVTVRYYLDGVETAPVNAGTYTVKIDVVQGSNYAAASNVTDNDWTFTIAKVAQASLSITGQPVGVITYGDSFTLAATGGSGTGGVTWSVSGDCAAVDASGVVTITGVGETTVTATRAADGNYLADVTDSYTFTPVQRQITVNPSATGGWTKAYDGGTAFETDAVTVGGITNKVGADDVTVSVAGAAYDTAAVGSGNKTLTITYAMSGAASANYVAPSNTVIRTASITAAAPTIALVPKTAVHTGSTIEIAAATVTGVAAAGDITADYAGAISYTYYTAAACADSDKTTVDRSGADTPGGAPKNAGTYYVKASIAASGNYSAAASAAVTLTIYYPSDDSAPAGTGTPVIVDGKTHNIGTEKKSGDTTTVTVDPSKLGGNIGGAAVGSSVVVPVSENGAATVSLVVKNIEDMAAKNMTLIVQTGKVAYNLNTSAIDTAALTAAFPGADMSKVPFNVTITNSSVTVEGETLVVPPVAFTVTAAYSGQTVSVDTFSAYIDRVIEVTAKQAAKITTAVVVNADGSVRHVPTNVVQRDGKWYAIVRSRTNSTYALIQNEVAFADAMGKWFEATVNEMGSRKIIGGRSASVFDGDAGITRAEFSAILVRALGLPADGTSTFSDVPASEWYAGAVSTAVRYGIVGGKGGNRFEPDAAITRQEAMLMLQRAAALTKFTGASSTLDSFADTGSIDIWAKDAAKWSVGSGLFQGTDSKLNPLAGITRAESATIILRLLQKAGLVDVRS